MADAKEYRRRITDIEAFMSALSAFLAVCEREPDDYFGVSNPRWWPKPGRESEATQLAAQVDRVAGRAAQAFGREFWIDHKPRGTFQTRPVSPAMHWRTILSDDPDLTVDVIFAVANQAIGTLELWAEQAEERERKRAEEQARRRSSRRAAATPMRLRHASERERASAQAESGGHMRGAIIASLVSIPATILTAYIVYRFGWS